MPLWCVLALFIGAFFLPMEIVTFVGLLCLICLVVADQVAVDRRNQKVVQEMTRANTILKDVQGSVDIIDGVTAGFKEQISEAGESIDELGITANDLRPLFDLLKENRDKIIELVQWISTVDWEEAGEKWDRAKELLDQLKRLDLEYLIGRLAKEDPDIDPYQEKVEEEKDWVMEEDDDGQKRFFSIPVD